MQLLTADVMSDLIDFRKKTALEYEISIINDTIYLRFHCGAMFEPSSFNKDFLDKDTMEKYFYMLNFTYNLSRKLIKVINETQI